LEENIFPGSLVFVKQKPISRALMCDLQLFYVRHSLPIRWYTIVVLPANAYLW